MCNFEVIGDPSSLRFTRKVAALVRVLATVDLNCDFVELLFIVRVKRGSREYIDMGVGIMRD